MPFDLLTDHEAKELPNFLFCPQSCSSFDFSEHDIFAQFELPFKEALLSWR